SRRRHTRLQGDWSSDVCSSDLAITFVCFRILAVNATTVAMVFLLSILVIAARWGLVEAVLASLAAMLCFNFFFLPPVGTFTIARSEERRVGKECSFRWSRYC